MRYIGHAKTVLRVLIILIVVALIVTLPVKILPDEGFEFVFGVSLLDMRDSHTIQLRQDLLEAALMDDYINVVFKDAARSAKKQREDIESMLESGIDALIVQPAPEEGVLAIMQSAKDMGIPVIALSNADFIEESTVQICLDDQWLGYMAGKYAVKLAGGEPMEWLEIQGDMSEDSARNRRDGFRSAIERSGNSGIRVSWTVSGYWRGEQAEINLENSGILEQGGNIRAVYAHNDEMAVAASRILRENGIDIPVIGIGGLWFEGLTAVQNGEISATIYYSSGGGAAYGTAKALLDGVIRPGKMHLGAFSIDKSNIGQAVRQ